MDLRKPCPFCGSLSIEIMKGEGRASHITFIKCYGCGLVASFHGKERYTETVSAWNQREMMH